MNFKDSASIASTGAFLVGELERLDPQLYEPLSDFTWGRDIDLREDVTIADDVTSFILSNYTGGFGGAGSGKSWISDGTSTPAKVSVSAEKVSTPLTPWGMDVSYTVFELQKAMQAGRPIDVQKFDAMRMKFQLDIDTQVYLGDEAVGVTGLLNSDAKVAKENVGKFSDATKPNEVLDFFNHILNNAWKATQFIRIPTDILVSPALFSKLASTQLPNTNMNLLEFVKANNLATANGNSLNIKPVKWLHDRARIVAYTKARDVVRFPMVQLQSMPVQYRNYVQSVPYYGALGGVEFVRPEMVYYGDLK